jgi:hypothetical protein
MEPEGSVPVLSFLIEHHATRTYWGSGGIVPRSLGLGTRWERSASRPGRFTSRERTPGIHWIGGWVGPRAGLDAGASRKFPAPTGTRTPNHPAHSPVFTKARQPLDHILYRTNPHPVFFLRSIPILSSHTQVYNATPCSHISNCRPVRNTCRKYLRFTIMTHTQFTLFFFLCVHTCVRNRLTDFLLHIGTEL